MLLATKNDLKPYVCTIPDFPKPGIMFRDFSTLVKDGAVFRTVIDHLVEHFSGKDFNKVVAIDSRGFILGGALCDRLGTGLVMARKPGKLPAKVAQVRYDLEYGSDAIEIHVDAIEKGDRVLIVDDLLATGGTAEAAAKLVESLGGEVTACVFAIALPDLGGGERLARYSPHWLMEFAGH